jgi:hypothetical protein
MIYGLESVAMRPYASYQMAVWMVATVCHQDTVLVLMDTQGSSARKVCMHPWPSVIKLLPNSPFYAIAECTVNCLHGTCLETENRCICHYGWTGSRCSEGRLHGYNIIIISFAIAANHIMHITACVLYM